MFLSVILDNSKMNELSMQQQQQQYPNLDDLIGQNIKNKDDKGTNSNENLSDYSRGTPIDPQFLEDTNENLDDLNEHVYEEINDKEESIDDLANGIFLILAYLKCKLTNYFVFRRRMLDQRIFNDISRRL